MLNSSAFPRHHNGDPAVYGHSRSRTTSSNTFPLPAAQQQHQAPMQVAMHLVQPSQGQHQRRSPSVNTFSTISSAGGTMMQPPAAYRTSPTTSSDLRRSTSSRSGGTTTTTTSPQQPSGYVALLRKQKATVWCDRAQYEDPRLLAAQRAARVRAQMQVVGGSGSSLGLAGSGGATTSAGRTSTGLSIPGTKVAAKIRHHGKPAVVGYAPENNYIGVGGVPMRLSATEVEGGDSDEEDLSMQRLHHRRTGSSGRSSTASGRRGVAYRTSGSVGGGRRWSPGDTPERTGSLVEENEGGATGLPANDAGPGEAGSLGSGSEGERADNVPDLGSNAARYASNSLLHSAITREKSVKTAEELKRRGSVDERAMSMSAGRLFIANPD
jgi:hypothetical protein